jgi:GT2 family glycosyltransferase
VSQERDLGSRAAPVPQVSAVIVNWNRLQDVLSAVRSVRACDYPQDRIEVVVVDNASDDGSAPHG